MYYPTLEQAAELAAGGAYGRVPVSREILCDFTSPVRVLRILQNVSRHCFLLESAEKSRNWGRYTFLGFHPTLEVSCTGGRFRVRASGADGWRTVREGTTEHPAAVLRECLSAYQSPNVPELPPFTGGLVGYFSYEYAQYAEPSIRFGDEAENFKDCDLMLFDKVIVFDNYRQKLIFIANAETEHLETSYWAACRELDAMVELARHGEPKPAAPCGLRSPLSPMFSAPEYCAMVEKAKHFIREGDIFQAVLSNRLQADYEGSLLNAYRILRATNPSPYMFYFSSDDIEMAGASPETLVKLENGILRTFPLAGTRPRGATPDEDAALERELLSDEKEIAEHNMLVDLGRNDIGKISLFGSVEVERHMSVERYSHVMHLASAVRGKLRPDKDALDAVDAILPAGTLSGAPKLRAMEIIRALEQSRRGLYGGAVGYLDFAGNLDLCIAIRLAFLKNGKVFVRSGAGIVADSVPEREHRECAQKAQAVIHALKLAQGGEEL